jgi:hypothetical protein
MKTSRGILIFAHNNHEIDYLTLAIVNSHLIQKNLGLSRSQITIVTDSHSYDYVLTTRNKQFIHTAAEIVFKEKDREFKQKNIRLYKDTSHTIKKLSFYNADRCDAYDISPYDETILLDADYLVLSNNLNSCWGHNNELMMNYTYKDVMSDRTFRNLDRVSPLGITMYWATVVYFQKTELTQHFFNVVKHVKENIEYYKSLYRWPGSLYRNDYSFSIAGHTISGFIDRQIPELPVTLYKTFDVDDVHGVMGENDLLMLVEKPRSPGDFTLQRWKDMDIHIMNKWALTRITDNLIGTL